MYSIILAVEKLKNVWLIIGKKGKNTKKFYMIHSEYDGKIFVNELSW